MTEEQTITMLSNPVFQNKIRNALACYFGDDFDVDVQFEIVNGFAVCLKDNRDLEDRTKYVKSDGNWEFKIVQEKIATTVFQFGEESKPEDFDSPKDFLYSLADVLNLNKFYENV